MEQYWRYGQSLWVTPIPFLDPGLFWSCSLSVRSFRPGLFRPDFRGGSFRPNFGGFSQKN